MDFAKMLALRVLDMNPKNAQESRFFLKSLMIEEGYEPGTVVFTQLAEDVAKAAREILEDKAGTAEEKAS